VGFKTPALKKLQGKTLAEVAKLRRKDPVEVMIDLLLETARASTRFTSSCRRRTSAS